MQFKIPLYDVLNMLLTGLVFICGVVFLFPESIIEVLYKSDASSIMRYSQFLSYACILAFIYEVGLIINRIGSILVEPLLKKAKLIDFVGDYRDFNDCKGKYPILAELSRNYGLARTSCPLFILLTLLAAIAGRGWVSFFFVAMSVLFFFSLRKCLTKINTLIGSSRNDQLQAPETAS